MRTSHNLCNSVSNIILKPKGKFINKCTCSLIPSKVFCPICFMLPFLNIRLFVHSVFRLVSTLFTYKPESSQIYTIVADILPLLVSSQFFSSINKKDISGYSGCSSYDKKICMEFCPLIDHFQGLPECMRMKRCQISICCVWIIWLLNCSGDKDNSNRRKVYRIIPSFNKCVVWSVMSLSGYMQYFILSATFIYPVQNCYIFYLDCPHCSIAKLAEIILWVYFLVSCCKHLVYFVPKECIMVTL